MSSAAGSRPVAVVLTALAVSAGTISVGVMDAAAAGAAVGLKAAVSVSPSASTMGQRVTANLSKTTRPSGDSLKRIQLNWGDGTAKVTVTSLSARPTHRYHRPGRYTVALTIVDAKGNTSRGTAPEHVTAPPGSYTGLNQFNGAFHFYVSYSHTAVQDVAINATALQCSPGGASVQDLLAIGSIPIASNGAFGITTARHGVFNHFPATFSYMFQGRFNGLSSQGTVAAAGTWRETITYTDSAARTCTTNIQSWSATRDAQPAQQYRTPPTGSYTGLSQFNSSFPLYVSANHNAIQDIYIPTALQCSPGTASYDDHLSIATAAIKADGSFTATATQHGVFANEPATFTYSITGHFHAVDTLGTPRAAGTWQETITYTDNAARTCTTNSQPFTVTRDAQPAQTAAAPPAGTYKGLNQFNGTFTFDVATDPNSVQNISITTALQCTPGTASYDDQLTIASIPLNADGSFAATDKVPGVFAGQPAQFTYQFAGQSHAVDRNGVPRIAGSYDETVTYTNGSTYTCTTDSQYYTATLSS